MLRKVFYLTKLIFSKWALSAADVRLIFELIKRHKKGDGKQNILIQEPHDYPFLIYSLLLINILRPKEVFGVQIYGPPRKRQGIKYKLMEWILSPSGLNLKWKLLYGVLGVKTKVDVSKKYSDQRRVSEILKGLNVQSFTAESVMNLKIEQIQIGDLIYDSFIRYKPSPTLVQDDPFLKELLEQAINIYLSALDFLDRQPVDLYLTSFTSYIYHGIMARVCLSRNIPVYALGSGNQLLVTPTLDFPWHKRNYPQYKKWADAYPDQEEMFREATKILENRFQGKRDQITSFMKTSAYSPPSHAINLAPGKKSVIVMAHDFYDSPHTWGEMLFYDFYDWLEFIMKVGSQSEVDYYVKPHPNALPESREIYTEFFKKYPKIKRLDPAVSNLAIARAGFHCAFTLNGTVAHEFAYLGLPTISCGANPHFAFDFTRTPKDLAQLKEWVLTPPTWTPNQAEVLKFVFMHNLYFIKQWMPTAQSVQTSADAANCLKNQYDAMVPLIKAELKRIENPQGFV